MLRSRIYRRLPFKPLPRAQVPALMRSYHPIYDGVTDAELLRIDDVFAHGNLRDWATFTTTAVDLCADAGRDRLDADVVANAYTLLGGGLGD
jgi:hypothetical protein